MARHKHKWGANYTLRSLQLTEKADKKLNCGIFLCMLYFKDSTFSFYLLSVLDIQIKKKKKQQDVFKSCWGREKINAACHQTKEKMFFVSSS